MLRLRWRLQCTAAEPERDSRRKEIEAHPPLLSADTSRRWRKRERLMIHLIFSRALFSQMSLRCWFLLHALSVRGVCETDRRIYMPATGCAPPIKHNEDDGCPSRHVHSLQNKESLALSLSRHSHSRTSDDVHCCHGTRWACNNNFASRAHTSSYCFAQSMTHLRNV